MVNIPWYLPWLLWDIMAILGMMGMMCKCNGMIIRKTRMFEIPLTIFLIKKMGDFKGHHRFLWRSVMMSSFGPFLCVLAVPGTLLHRIDCSCVGVSPCATSGAQSRTVAGCGMRPYKIASKHRPVAS